MSERLALLIANSDYEDPQLLHLLSPSHDSESLAEVLRDTEIGGFNVTLIINQPTNVVRRQIERLFKDKKSDDLLLLYYSGHGIKDDYGDLFLSVKDTDFNFPHSTAIDSKFISSLIDKSLSRRKVIILDCCFSGAFHRSIKSLGTEIDTNEAFTGNGFGRVILTASNSLEYAWEGTKLLGKSEMSVFTQQFVEGLKTGEADANGDGKISLDEIYMYVYKRVIKNSEAKQTPKKFDHDVEGEIIIAKAPKTKVYIIEGGQKEEIRKLKPLPQLYKDLSHGEKQRLLRIEEELGSLVIGQRKPIRILANTIRRTFVGLRDKKIPIGSFFFVGPPGVGKTLLAEILAEYLFGTEAALVKLQMGDYMEKFNVTKLIGPPPGYVGYEEGGILTEAVKRRPECVVLLERIELANPDVYNYFLTVLGDGYITDARGQKIDFSHSIVIFEFHGGNHFVELLTGPIKGIKHNKDVIEEIRIEIIREMERYFDPSFIGRLSEIVVFNVLKKEEIEEIINLKLNQIFKEFSRIGINIVVTNSAIQFLLEKCYDPKKGAHMVESIVNTHIESVLAQKSLQPGFNNLKNIRFEFNPGKGKLETLAT